MARASSCRAHRFIWDSYAVALAANQALRVLKRKLQREGLFREIKRRRAYEKPSEKRVREKREGIRRGIKAARKLAQREGLLPKPRSKPRGSDSLVALRISKPRQAFLSAAPSSFPCETMQVAGGDATLNPENCEVPGSTWIPCIWGSPLNHHNKHRFSE